MKKVISIYTTLVLTLIICGTIQAQIRIDKQQCFGGYGDDIAYSIVEEECLSLEKVDSLKSKRDVRVSNIEKRDVL